MCAKKKNRESIPKDIAARTLFQSDRTCCVCRVRGKVVQIHHVDENPANHDLRNLAVLCFDCHHETQVKGGFDRKLDAEQIFLYRDDWHRVVTRNRAVDEMTAQREPQDWIDINYATSIAEIYRENCEHELLAIHYDVLGNTELRNKYIELALSTNPTDDTVIYLRGLQNRIDLIPQDVIDREYNIKTVNKDWTQRARMLTNLGRHQEAVNDYLTGIQASLKDNRIFSAAFYLKEMAETNLINELFVLALKQAQSEGDLWWQVRSLQELGWDSELNVLLQENEKVILESDDLNLIELLTLSKGDHATWLEIEKKRAHLESMAYEPCKESE